MKQTVSVAELRKDIQEASDEELMRKYGFARKDLEVLMDTFAGAHLSKVGRSISEQP